MATNIVIPELGESVTDGVIATWRKQPGEFVNRDETVLELETDKITMELPSPASGVLTPGNKVGDRVKVGAVVGSIDESAQASVSSGDGAKVAKAKEVRAGTGAASAPADRSQPANGTHKVASSSTGSAAASVAAGSGGSGSGKAESDVRSTPLARKLAEERGIDLGKVQGTGAGGRIREQDVLQAGGERGDSGPLVEAKASAAPRASSGESRAEHQAGAGHGGVRRERMSTLRQRIAQRLVEAQHNAAMLTTFNEVDMTAVRGLRSKHKEAFEKKHGVGLGFMSFFVKACVLGLQNFPLVNASVVRSAEGELEIEHHESQAIAVAVGTPKGLVVPVLRQCESLSFAQVEAGIKELAAKARDGKLALADMQGGTFTITNGGIYGSLMSTPILNPPQTGILGMHSIKNRAVEDPNNPGQVAIRPMMYLALSYDHRLVDGAEAVQFLVVVKNAIEQPERLLIGV